MQKLKPNMNVLLQIIISVLIALLIYSPIFVLLGLDNIAKDEIRKQEEEINNQVAQQIAQIEVADNLTIDEVILNYEDVNKTYWSARYYDYDNIWKIKAYADHEVENSYDTEDVISVTFTYSESTNELLVEEILLYDRTTEERDYTSYSTSESREIFNKMIEEAIK